MYVTAHRVHAPSTGQEGINAFYYVHGPYTWDGVPPAGIPDQNPGTLVAQTVVIRPPGNRVRSYLDVVAPDDTSSTETRRSFITFVSSAQRNPFPWLGVVGRCFFRIGMERGLAQEWQREVAELYRAVQAVRIGG